MLDGPGMHILHTPRLQLRHLEARDLDALAAMYADPELRRFFPDGTQTRDETARELAYFAHGHPRHPRLGLWATVDRASGRLLGRCGLLPWTVDGRDEVELAYLIDTAHQRQGYATEAAQAIVVHARDTLGLARLISLITPGNAASVCIAQKVGMRFERTMEDEWGPCHIYAVTLSGDIGRCTGAGALALSPSSPPCR
ncbi:MAG: GNAT family N-acetyltransferase [Rubrivivax sp.]|nr:GNAT family N-acetyltransferase [Rubrivivax sp.]